MALVAGFGTTAQAALSAQVFFDDEETLSLTAGRATNLKMEFFDSESSEPLHHFHPMHEKDMHLLIISEDMQSFAHVHPTKLSEHLAIFGLDLNTPNTDPDNYDATQAISTAGKYFLFAEAMPMGYSMTTVPVTVEARGEKKDSAALTLDPVSADGSIHKTFGDYRLHLKVKTYPHCGTFAALLEMTVQFREDSQAEFRDVTDIEPWLSSFAHTVMLSQAGQTAADKKFVHLHAVWPLVDDPDTERGPYLRVASDSHSPMNEGVFKIWVQFKHRGRVQTLPFVIEIKAPPGLGAAHPLCF